MIVFNYFNYFTHLLRTAFRLNRCYFPWLLLDSSQLYAHRAFGSVN